MTTYDYDSIGMALMLGRRQGKTHNMIANALKNTTIITTNAQEAYRIKDLARSLKRNDLSVISVQPKFREHCTGRSGSYILDHYAASTLLTQAQKDIDDEKEKVAKLKDELQKIQIALQSIVTVCRQMEKHLAGLNAS